MLLEKGARPGRDRGVPKMQIRRTLQEINHYATHDGYAAARRFLAHHKPGAQQFQVGIK